MTVGICTFGRLSEYQLFLEMGKWTSGPANVRGIIHLIDSHHQPEPPRVSVVARRAPISSANAILKSCFAPFPEMAPAINLLQELLSEISQRVVEGAKVHRGQHVRFLSHVDRQWRSVALDTPQLWTTSITKAPFVAVYDFECIAVWSGRTKTVPTTFVLRDMEQSVGRLCSKFSRSLDLPLRPFSSSVVITGLWIA